jgi:geranylgeranyl diphosphate synthase type 3/geranylgeranyl diphosphate synthase type I
MRKDIEAAIRKYFPTSWTKNDILFFLKKIGYQVDMFSLNNNLNAPIRDFVLRGGKRLRPVLFLKCLETFNIDSKKYIDFAVVIELLHNGTLVLDDIEDNGKLRRGKPTCHRKFGLDTAVNVGGSLYIIPLQILLSSSRNLTDNQVKRLCKVYAEELTNVSFGQSIDIFWHNNPGVKVTKRKYLEMVRLKTGSLMRMSLRMAAIIAKKNSDTEENLEKFGENIGMAFQIRDDSLDLVSKDKRFGKTYGNDITEGKMSLPVVLALETATKRDKKRLLRVLSMHTRDRKLIKESVDIIKKTGAIEESIKFANRLVDNAWKNLEREYKGKRNLDGLKELTYFFVKREY